MFPPKWIFFEIGVLNILSSIQKSYNILNHIGKVQFPASPCCYFTLFDIVTARYGLPYLKAEGFWGNITIFASQMTFF